MKAVFEKLFGGNKYVCKFPKFQRDVTVKSPLLSTTNPSKKKDKICDK